MRRRVRTFPLALTFVAIFASACRPPSITANLDDLEGSPHALGRLNLANFQLGDVLLIDHEEKTYGLLWHMKELKNDQAEEPASGTTRVTLSEHVKIGINGGTLNARAWLRTHAARLLFLELNIVKHGSLPKVEIELNQLYAAAKTRTDMAPSRITNAVLTLYETMAKTDVKRYSFAIVTRVSYGNRAFIRHDALVSAAAKVGVNLVDVGTDVEAARFSEYFRESKDDSRLLYDLTGVRLEQADKTSPFRTELGRSMNWSGYRRLR